VVGAALKRARPGGRAPQNPTTAAARFRWC